MSSSVIGLGLIPGGTGVCGYGIVATEDAVTFRFYEDEAGAEQEASFIDPSSKDIVFNSNGSIRGQTANEQEVYLAIATTYNSSAIPEFGCRMYEIKTLNENTINLVRAYINEALAKLVKSTRITVQNVSVTRSQYDRLSITVKWIDNATSSVNITTI